MSMPELPQPHPGLTQEGSLHMILSSIAMEEAALSHILNAEGEKIQAVLAHQAKSCGCVDTDAILAVNKSVAQLLDVILQNQIILKSKMEKVLEHLPKPPPPPPRPPCPPPEPPPHPAPCPPMPPESPCQMPPAPPSRLMADYRAVPGPRCRGEALLWDSPPGGGTPCHQSQILLPGCRCLSLRLDVEGTQRPQARDAALELRISCRGKPLLSKLFCATATGASFCCSGNVIIQLPEGYDACCAVLSPASPLPLQIRRGRLLLYC